jgi:hypothetical protein
MSVLEPGVTADRRNVFPSFNTSGVVSEFMVENPASTFPIYIWPKPGRDRPSFEFVQYVIPRIEGPAVFSVFF